MVEAARRCFVERGLSDTHVRHISQEARVAHGTFYVHFENKEEVLGEILSELNRELRGGLAPALLSSEAIPIRVRRAAEVFLDFCDANRAFVECYAQRLIAGSGIEALRDGINPEVRGLLLALFPRREGEHGPEWSLLVHGLLAMWIRIGLQYLFNDEAPDRERVVETLSAMTVGAVVAASEV